MDRKADDREIIELFFARDERALKLTDEKYKNYLLTVAYNLLHDSLDCEECLNDTYLAAWNAIPPADPRSLKAFLTELIRRKAVNLYKKRCQKKYIPSELTVSMEDLHAAIDTGAQNEYETERLREIINSFLRSLPERRRAVFIERYYTASSVESIAAELKISPWTVYKAIEKIKAELKSYLKENEVYL